MVNVGQLEDSRTGHWLLARVLYQRMSMPGINGQCQTSDRTESSGQHQRFCPEIQLKGMHERGKETCQEEGGKGGCVETREGRGSKYTEYTMTECKLNIL